jgi:hypothetical protein
LDPASHEHTDQHGYANSYLDAVANCQQHTDVDTHTHAYARTSHGHAYATAAHSHQEAATTEAHEDSDSLSILLS